MDGSISNSMRGGAEYRPDSLRDRGLLPESRGLVIREPQSAGEVLKKVAEHSRHIPPPEDLLQVTAAAARYALTSLDSAKRIAAEIRAEQAKISAAEAESLAEGADRAEVAEALRV